MFNKLAVKRQLEIWGKQLEAKQEKLDDLQGVDTPESEIQREELAEQIADLETTIAGAEEQLEEDQAVQNEHDFFND